MVHLGYCFNVIFEELQITNFPPKTQLVHYFMASDSFKI